MGSYRCNDIVKLGHLSTLWRLLHMPLISCKAVKDNGDKQEGPVGILAHQVNNIVQLEQVPDLITAVHQGNQPRAHLGRNCIDSIADDVVQQLVGMPRLTASLPARTADILDGRTSWGPAQTSRMVRMTL